MLPTSIYVNPKFKAHINPNFLTRKVLQTNNTKIHINPNFLPKSPIKNVEIDRAPIIKNTRRKLIRQSNSIVNPKASNPTTPQYPKNKLIKIGKNKLIRIAEVKQTIKLPEVVKQTASVRSKYKIVRSPTEQQRKLLNPSLIRKKFITNKYSLRRVSFNESLIPQKVFVTDKKLMRIGLHKIQRPVLKKTNFSNNIKFRNKNLELLNINGVLYKSTTNKLQKSDLPTLQVNKFKNNNNINSKKDTKRLVLVRGEKFALESNGKSLRRIDLQNTVKIRRIDIGGLTYLQKTDSTYERTESHKTRNYLSLAKCKSINVLTKKFAKSNIPCPIFRRLGKCLAFNRNRCPKVHDPKHVTICPKHLKGECNADNCLLSHDVTLSKMPTCKFFLQGCCVKVNCSYLHKKLNDKVGICENFLKGFCSNAEKCQKRHEFLCPSYESSGKCIKTRCEYPHKNQHLNIEKTEIITTLPTTQNISLSVVSDNKKQENLRYYTDKDDSQLLSKNNINNNLNEIKLMSSNVKDDDNNQIITLNVVKRPLKDILPAYIPF